MIYVRILLTGLFALITALLLALASLGAKPASNTVTSESTGFAQNFVGDIKGAEGSPIGVLGHGMVARAPPLAVTNIVVNQFGVNRGIADSKLQHNYLNEEERELADEVLAGLRRCGAGPLTSSGDKAACSQAQHDLSKLQISSANNTVGMLNTCRDDLGSAECASAQKEAADYLEWSSGLFNSRDGYFDVSAAEVAKVDWGGNLDALALDVYAQDKTGQSAYDEITDRAVLYDGRMNLAVGAGTVAVSTVACIGTAGIGCAIAVGGAVVSEANNIYDGAATVYTKSEQKGAIQHMLEAGDLSEEQAKLWENRIELGLSVLSFGTDSVVTLRNVSTSGKMLDDVFDYGKTDINPLEIREAYANGPSLTQEQIDKILSLGKGNRPDPLAYMSTTEIEVHLEKFDDGAVRFTSREAVEKYGTAGNSEAFVMPKSEFDRVVVEAGGDLRIVEQRLSLDSGYLSNNDTMAVHIRRQDMLGLRVPSGNEAGANTKWLPGGYTADGVPEAVVDLTGAPFTEIPY